ncbi:MAG TPA: MarR family transcriptional regulator [Candidatus Fimiplasma intestinipullorum]|uniref:MarR family transcriptional regulator n=1 Tax=Candidatus Fimiplasma intestinipullorum TaxID=2840825 RepID=A0A9D1HLE5_9FIRM|nr:MarR family transcriptional regulator [Candidatus Fimiplasma intestinipullorum]
MQQDFISILRYITILSDNTELFFSRSFEKQNLSSSRQIALLKIDGNPGLTMSQLGQVTHYQKSAISKIVNELIEKSYITMTIDAQDRRIKHLYPMPKTDQPIASILELCNWWLDQLFEGYSAQERETLYQCLIALARRSSIILEGEKKNAQKNSYFYYAAANALFYFPGRCSPV